MILVDSPLLCLINSFLKRFSPVLTEMRSLSSCSNSSTRRKVANQLIQSRGIIAENLDIEEAQKIQQRFVMVGARTTIEPMDTSGIRYRVQITEPVLEDRQEVVLEYISQFIEDENVARDVLESGGVVADNLTLFRAKQVLRELEERRATAEIEEMSPI